MAHNPLTLSTGLLTEFVRTFINIMGYVEAKQTQLVPTNRYLKPVIQYSEVELAHAYTANVKTNALLIRGNHPFDVVKMKFNLHSKNFTFQR